MASAPGVRVLGAAFNDGKGGISKSDGPGSIQRDWVELPELTTSGTDSRPLANSLAAMAD